MRGTCVPAVAFSLLSGTVVLSSAILLCVVCLYPPDLTLQENTNKAVIADLYIHDADLASSAFAAVAFTSGVSGRYL